MIKRNPYSEILTAALQAVADISHPDYQVLPLDPTPEMLVAAGQSTGLTADQLRQAYLAMVTAWNAVEAQPSAS